MPYSKLQRVERQQEPVPTPDLRLYWAPSESERLGLSYQSALQHAADHGFNLPDLRSHIRPLALRARDESIMPERLIAELVRLLYLLPQFNCLRPDDRDRTRAHVVQCVIHAYFLDD